MRALPYAVVLLVATAAAAQQRSIFDADDFVDPSAHAGVVFASRLIAGASRGLVDDYRPLHQDAGFLHLTNSVYWSRFEFDYKHTEVRGEDQNGPIRVQSCGCSEPVYFPTPAPPDATPAAPLPGSKETVQFGWYYTVPGSGAHPRITARLRLTASRRSFDTIVESGTTGQVVSRRSGHEQSFGLDTDTHFRIRGHDLFGSLAFAHTANSGTTADRKQSELTYMQRFSAVPVGRVLLRGMVTAGGVTNRGGTAINVVNPAFEAFWHHWGSRANIHLIWSPQMTRSGANGWETNHQIALFVDRALIVKVFR